MLDPTIAGVMESLRADGYVVSQTAEDWDSPPPPRHILFDVSDEDFNVALDHLRASAESLWPDRPARVRETQLLLVHLDEDFATRIPEDAAIRIQRVGTQLRAEPLR